MDHRPPMKGKETSALRLLALHNQWANDRTFAACSDVAPEKLTEPVEGYDSVIGILHHLVQVEHAFFELAHGRVPRRLEVRQLDQLRTECARIDGEYLGYVDTLGAEDSLAKEFLVPWFGFSVNLVEGVLQPLTHSHKHRADISMLLPRLGGAGIEMDLIQWLDEDRGSPSSG